MSALPKRRFTPEEYLALECAAEGKSQYIAGEIFAMSGAPPEHVLITTNLIAALHQRFRGRSCRVLNSDLRVAIPGGDLYTYPDLSALCGEARFDGVNPPCLLNPQVIVEVLSPSTEAFDRGEKFARYRRLESLSDYVLVAVGRMRVEHHWLQPSGVWKSEEHDRPAHVLRLASVDCEIPLAEIYERIVFPA